MLSRKSKRAHSQSTFLSGVVILILVLGFIKFSNAKSLKEKSKTPEASSNTQTYVYPSPSENDNECGDFPDQVTTITDKVERDNYAQLSGPVWSTDCKYISWGVWQSTFPNPEISEGLFLYSVVGQNWKQVYIPKDDESITLEKWQDMDTIIFTKDGQKVLYKYSISSSKISQ